MERYHIEWRRSTKKDLRRIPSGEARRLIDAVERLANIPRPSGSTKLRGSDCAYRIRVGDYRVIYEIHDRRVVIEVIRIRHRKDIYRK